MERLDQGMWHQDRLMELRLKDMEEDSLLSKVKQVNNIPVKL
jgi:hypothetical protein